MRPRLVSQGGYRTHLIRPGESHQSWAAYHDYRQGLRRAYARYGVEELASSTQPAMVAVGYSGSVMVGGLAITRRECECDRTVLGWFHGGWSVDRAFSPVLGRYPQLLLRGLDLDEAHAEAGPHALATWALGGAQPIAGPHPGPAGYQSYHLRVVNETIGVAA